MGIHTDSPGQPVVESIRITIATYPPVIMTDPQPEPTSPASSNEKPDSVGLELSEPARSDLAPISASPSRWNALITSATTVTGVVSQAVSQAGNSVGGAMTSTANSLGDTAARTGSAIVETAKNMGGAVGQAASTAGTMTLAAVKKVPEGLGSIATIVTENPQLRLVTKHLKIDHLLYGLIDQVDIDRAQSYVQKLQTKYPTETSYQIAHRLILQKAIYAGGTGFASSFVPGTAASLFALDLAATLALQAEMLYQIAAAYHLDLHDPARKGEVLAIFGLTLGGNSGIKAGLGFARNLPTVGAVIGASSNAVLIYSLGQAACQFYGAKMNPLNSMALLKETQAETEQYLRFAIDQEIIMDQILMHIIVAGDPGKTWGDLLSNLTHYQFSDASIEAIKATAESPPLLSTLLDQINPDFAASLIAQCQRLANADGILTTAESAALEQIIQAKTMLGFIS
jgi:uncharacterized protein (DUF697 family)